MQSIGYSHMTALIAGALDREECLRTLKRDTRRFAKRQMTWFRAYPDIRWAAPEHPQEIIRLAEGFPPGNCRLSPNFSAASDNAANLR